MLAPAVEGKKMKRKIYDNGAIVRICLLFFYPFGLVLLAMSHIVKHKFLITVMYLVPFVVIGFPIIAAVIGDKMIINSDIYRIIFIFMAVIVFPIAFLSYIVLILQDKTS